MIHGGLVMNNRLFGLLIAGVLGTSLAIASPAQAFRGGMGGGGMHMGGGGMHWGGGGGMHMGGGMRMGGGMHFAARPFGGRFAGAPFAHRAVFAPHFRRFAFHDRRFFFRHRFHHFNRFAFIGAPFAYAGYDSCWRRVWTAYGPQWVNVCNLDYPY
jgi:hypothetical protein